MILIELLTNIYTYSFLNGSEKSSKFNIIYRQCFDKFIIFQGLDFTGTHYYYYYYYLHIYYINI